MRIDEADGLLGPDAMGTISDIMHDVGIAVVEAVERLRALGAGHQNFIDVLMPDPRHALGWFTGGACHGGCRGHDGFGQTLRLRC